MPTMNGKHWLETHSGNQFVFDLPFITMNVYVMDDIAHGLAHLCRFNGQCAKFYSVAQHSVVVASYAMKGYADDDILRGLTKDDHKVRDYIYYRALFHDAAEAYIGDMTKPLKDAVECTPYNAMADQIHLQVLRRIREFIGIGQVELVNNTVRDRIKALVKEADSKALNAERHCLMPRLTVPWMYELKDLTADDTRIIDFYRVRDPWLPEEAKRHFKGACSGFDFTN